MMKRLCSFFVVVVLSCLLAGITSSVLAQSSQGKDTRGDLPMIAVYITGSVSEDMKSVVSSRMLRKFIDSRRYRGIERSAAFLAEIEREQEKQLSGAVDDGQIIQIGRMFGLKEICIAAMTQVFGQVQLSVRIVDVETAQILIIGEVTGKVESMPQLSRLADNAVNTLLRRQDKEAKRQAAAANARMAEEKRIAEEKRAAEEARAAKEARAIEESRAAEAAKRETANSDTEQRADIVHYDPTSDAQDENSISQDNAASVTDDDAQDENQTLQMASFDHLKDALPEDAAGSAAGDMAAGTAKANGDSNALTRHKRTVRISGAAVGAAGIVGGIIFNAVSDSSYKKYTDAKTSQEARDARYSTENAEAGRNIFYTLAGVGLAAMSVTFFF